MPNKNLPAKKLGTSNQKSSKYPNFHKQKLGNKKTLCVCHAFLGPPNPSDPRASSWRSSASVVVARRGVPHWGLVAAVLPPKWEAPAIRVSPGGSLEGRGPMWRVEPSSVILFENGHEFTKKKSTWLKWDSPLDYYVLFKNAGWGVKRHSFEGCDHQSDSIAKLRASNEYSYFQVELSWLSASFKMKACKSSWLIK